MLGKVEAEMTLGAVRFDGLSPTDFEEFCFDLLSESGLGLVRMLQRRVGGTRAG